MADEVARLLEESNREKRLLSDELHSVRMQLSRCQRELKSRESVLQRHQREIDRLNADLVNAREPLDDANTRHHYSANSITIDELRREMNSFLRSSPIDPHMLGLFDFEGSARQVLVSFFATLRVILSDQWRLEDLGPSSRKSGRPGESEVVRALREQLDHEHRLIAKLAMKLTATPQVAFEDAEPAVAPTIRSIGNTLSEILAPIRRWVKREFGYESSQAPYSEMIRAVVNRLEDLTAFMLRARAAFRIDDQSVEFEGLLTLLEARLQSVKKLELDNLRLTEENRSLERQCLEIASIADQRSNEFKKSHCEAVAGLQSQLSGLFRSQDSDSLGQLHDLQTRVTSQSEEIRKLKASCQSERELHQLTPHQLKMEQITVQRLKAPLAQKEINVKELEEDALYRSEVQSSHEQETLKRKVSSLTDSLEKAEKIAQRSTSALEAKDSEKRSLRKELDQQQLAAKELDSRLRACEARCKKLLCKLNDRKETESVLVSKLEKLQRKYDLMKHSFWQLELQSCSKSDLDQCVAELDEKEQTVCELKSQIATHVNDLDSRQLVVEELQKKMAQSDEQNNSKLALIGTITSQVKLVHDFLAKLTNEATFCPPTIIKLIDLLKPVFISLSLSVFGFEFVREPLRTFISARIVSVRPNPDNEFIKPEYRDALDQIHRELLTFPIHRGGGPPSVPTFEPMFGKLRNVLGLVKVVRTLFRENEESANRLSSLVKSQHAAIVQMTRGP
jgi:hypothetical protein